MGEIRIVFAIAVLASGTMVSAAEPEHTATFYCYGNQRIELAVVADELSVGKFAAEDLFNRATVQIDAVAVEVQAPPLGTAT
jgi:hypothetical protein